MKQFITFLFITTTLVSTGCGSSALTGIGKNNAGGDSGGNNGGGTPEVPAVYEVYGTDSAGNLLLGNTDSLNSSITNVGVITGLTGNVVGLSHSPARDLFALTASGTDGRIYKIDKSTLVATQVGTGALSTALNGTKFGFSYNPATDHMRVTSDTGQNLDIDATSGTPIVTPQTTLAYAASDSHNGQTPHIVISSSSCNCDQAVPTLYGIDTSGFLVSIGSLAGNPSSAHSGQLFSIGQTSLSVTTTSSIALALPDKATFAFASVASSIEAESKVYKIQLDTGATTLLGTATGLKIETLSVVP